MKILFFLFALTFLISLKSVASEALPGFEVVPEKYKNIMDSIVVPDMPPVRTQGGLPICYAVAASTIIEQRTCVKDKLDCQNLPDSKRPSILGLAKFSIATDLKKNPTKSDRPMRYDDGDAYPRKIYGDDAGQAAEIVINASQANDVASESCAPYSGFIIKGADGRESTHQEVEAWNDLRRAYNIYRKDVKTCRKCAEDAARVAILKTRDRFSLQTDVDQELSAFSLDSYELFLSKFLIPDKCNEYGDDTYKFIWMHSKVGYFPDNYKRPSYTETINMVIKVLKQGDPILASICSMNSPTRKCVDNGESRRHALVISGFRKMCDDTNCIDVIHVQNTWGSDWQVEYADGWIDAKALLSRLAIQRGALFWIEDWTPEDLKKEEDEMVKKIQRSRAE